MADEKTPVVWDDVTKKHRPLGTGEKMGGLDASSIISSDSGNLIQTGSDGLAYVSGSSLADPRADNLLETSQNGKLQVTIDRIAEWLDGHPQDAAALADAMNVVSTDAGNIIVQGSDKGAYLSNAQLSAAFAGLSDAQKQAIAQAIAAKMAAQLADGRTIVAADGKLTSDPTNATAAQKSAINAALADADSGLVVDPSTGRLQVDFSQMPTDKFEELLKSLKMLVPLSANLTLYVAISDSASGDDIVDGRGTEAKPFKHIQACVDYVANTYSLGTHSVTIRVKSGTYTEALRLPRLASSGGYVSIVSHSGSHDVTVEAPLSGGFTANCLSAGESSHYYLRYLGFRLVTAPGDIPEVGRNIVMVGASGGARLDLYGCTFAQSAGAGTYTGGNYSVGCIVADGGEVWIQHSALGFTMSCQTAEHVGVICLTAKRSGSITLTRTVNDDLVHTFACSGSCTVFASCFDDGSIRPYGSGSKIQFTGSMTGKRYEVSSGSYINGAGSDTYFPGDSDPAGTVDASTYSWYK